jgi:hypothetical protein
MRQAIGQVIFVWITHQITLTPCPSPAYGRWEIEATRLCCRQDDLTTDSHITGCITLDYRELGSNHHILILLPKWVRFVDFDKISAGEVPKSTFILSRGQSIRCFRMSE